MIKHTLTAAAVALALAATASIADTKAEEKKPAAKKVRPESSMIQIYVQGDPAFDPGASELKADGKAQIDKMLKTAREGTKRDPRPFTISSVVLAGHSDSIEDKTDKLSVARAVAVKNYLVSQGVDEKLIFWEGKGAKSPVPVTKFCDDKMPQQELVTCLQPNRRVVVEMGGTKPGKPKKK